MYSPVMAAGRIEDRGSQLQQLSGWCCEQMDALGGSVHPEMKDKDTGPQSPFFNHEHSRNGEGGGPCKINKTPASHSHLYITS